MEGIATRFPQYEGILRSTAEANSRDLRMLREIRQKCVFSTQKRYDKKVVGAGIPHLCFVGKLIPINKTMIYYHSDTT